MQVGEIEQDAGERQTNVKGRVVERDHEYLTWNNIDVFFMYTTGYILYSSNEETSYRMLYLYLLSNSSAVQTALQMTRTSRVTVDTKLLSTE